MKTKDYMTFIGELKKLNDGVIEKVSVTHQGVVGTWTGKEVSFGETSFPKTAIMITTRESAIRIELRPGNFQDEHFFPIQFFTRELFPLLVGMETLLPPTTVGYEIEHFFVNKK